MVRTRLDSKLLTMSVLLFSINRFFQVFEYSGNTLRTFFDSPACDTDCIQNVSWTKDDSYAIVYLVRI